MIIKHRITSEVLFDGEVSDLNCADLCYADLRDYNLRRTDLSGANLVSADLSWADLRAVNLRAVNLRAASLRAAILRAASLMGANLFYTDLRNTDLEGADLRNANFFGANLMEADLRNADLVGANLMGAKLPHFQIVPESGSFYAYKKTNLGVIKIQIPARAKRTSSLVGRKCRAEFVKVISGDGVGGISTYDRKTKYNKGELVYADNYNDDIRIECTGGIHFFMTKAEAEEW